MFASRRWAGRCLTSGCSWRLLPRPAGRGASGRADGQVGRGGRPGIRGLPRFILRFLEGVGLAVIPVKGRARVAHGRPSGAVVSLVVLRGPLGLQILVGTVYREAHRAFVRRRSEAALIKTEIRLMRRARAK
jgi:hypothetical protein